MALTVEIIDMEQIELELKIDELHRLKIRISELEKELEGEG